MPLMLACISLILVVILSAFFIALYFYFTRNFKFWQKLGVPYVKPTPFVGNLKDCVLMKVSFWKKLQQIYNENSYKPYVGIFSLDKPCLLIRDTELVKNVLVKDSHFFINHIITFNEENEPIFSKILYMLRDQHWRHLRTKLTPVFSSAKMKKMFYLVDTCGKELAECLDRATVGGSNVNVGDIMYRYTIDVIGSCAFGINSNSLQDPQSEFRHFLRKIFDFSVRKALAALTAFIAPTLTSLLKLKFLDDDTNKYLRKTVWSTVEYREKYGVLRNDLLDCLMELRNRGKEGRQESDLSVDNPSRSAAFQIDGDVLVAQAMFFLAAGYETSGSTLCFALYELALRPEIQHSLRTEIVQVLNKHNGEVTYDCIQEMSYLDKVVSETLRKYPILPFLDRKCSTGYKLPAPTGNGTVTLPAGIDVYIPVLALHHDPTYYPEPKKFDPDRFTEENKKGRPNYTYLPFGEGPRICLGMRFGQMQVKAGLCHILSRFEVAPCKDTPVPIVFDPKCVMLTWDEGIRLSFKRIHQ